MLKITEFFPSIQGEGKEFKPSIFLRLFGCNYDCTWCDSKFSISMKYNSKVDDMIASNLANNIIHIMNENNINNLVITGGEPFLQQDALYIFLYLFLNTMKKRFTLEFETNGSILLDKKIVKFLMESKKIKKTTFNISPKLSNSGAKVTTKHKVNFRKNIKLLDSCWKTKIDYILKFVVDSNNFDEDLKEIKIFLDINKIKDSNLVYLMPQGTRTDEIRNGMKFLVDQRVKGIFNYNISPRLHILLWDNKKGV